MQPGALAAGTLPQYSTIRVSVPKLTSLSLTNDQLSPSNLTLDTDVTTDSFKSSGPSSASAGGRSHLFGLSRYYCPVCEDKYKECGCLKCHKVFVKYR